MGSLFGLVISWLVAIFVLIFGLMLILFTLAQARQVFTGKTKSVSALQKGEGACVHGKVKDTLGTVTSPLGQVRAVYWQAMISTSSPSAKSGSHYSVIDKKSHGDRFVLADSSGELEVRFGGPSNGVTVDVIELSQKCQSFSDQQFVGRPFSKSISEPYLNDRSQGQRIQLKKMQSKKLTEQSISSGQDIYVWGKLETNAQGGLIFLATKISDSPAPQHWLKSGMAFIAGVIMIQMGLALF